MGSEKANRRSRRRVSTLTGVVMSGIGVFHYAFVALRPMNSLVRLEALTRPSLEPPTGRPRSQSVTKIQGLSPDQVGPIARHADECASRIECFDTPLVYAYGEHGYIANGTTRSTIPTGCEVGRFMD